MAPLRLKVKQRISVQAEEFCCKMWFGCQNNRFEIKVWKVVGADAGLSSFASV